MSPSSTGLLVGVLLLLTSPVSQFATSAAEPPAALAAAYDQPLRPQFHFTAERNWLNDPNGLVFYEGEYHLFFQHNPLGNEWGNMTWGHAVSDDLVHWRQLPNALEPDALGTIFSGSAVVDWHNTAGFQTGEDPALVAIYTAAGGTSPQSQGAKFTQCLAYSNDRGRTWTKYAGNPVLPHVAGENRDPKVVWHEPSRQWVMALYLDGADFALFGSPDLKAWTRLSDISVPGSIECPDIFELPIEGRPGESRWIFWVANNVYLVGAFDGRTFTPEGEPQRFEHGANCFAAQTFSDIPANDGRRIQIAWMRGGVYPAMPFNQQMSFPSTLTLHATPDGPRLRRLPVKEIESLRGKPFQWEGDLSHTSNPLAELAGETYEIDLSLTPARDPRESEEPASASAPAAASLSLVIRGMVLTYHPKSGELLLGGQTVTLKSSQGESTPDGKLRLRILIDRTSIEVFANEGAVSFTSCFLPTDGAPAYRLSGERVRIDSLTAWPLKSAW